MHRFPSLTAAGRSVDASTQQIIDSIETQRCCKGFTFVYVDNIPSDIQEYLNSAHRNYQKFHKRPKMSNSRRVQVAETGQEFDSISAAARFIGCDAETVKNRINSGRTVNGITLQFVDDEENR
jgi:hypothetical protein